MQFRLCSELWFKGMGAISAMFKVGVWGGMGVALADVQSCGVGGRV